MGLSDVGRRNTGSVDAQQVPHAEVLGAAFLAAAVAEGALSAEVVDLRARCVVVEEREAEV